VWKNGGLGEKNPKNPKNRGYRGSDNADKVLQRHSVNGGNAHNQCVAREWQPNPRNANKCQTPPLPCLYYGLISQALTSLFTKSIPAFFLKIAAVAIIAPLSVHSDGCGQIKCRDFSLHLSLKISRNL